MSNKLMTSLTRPIEKNFLVCPVFAGIDYRGGGDNVGEVGNDVGKGGNETSNGEASFVSLQHTSDQLTVKMAFQVWTPRRRVHSQRARKRRAPWVRLCQICQQVSNY